MLPRYIENLDVEPLPSPLDRSAALGTIEDLEPYLDRIPRLEADALEACGLHGVRQESLAVLLGVTQCAIHSAIKAGVRRVQWLRSAPPWDPAEGVRALRDALPPRQRWKARVIAYWLGSIYSISHAMRLHGYCVNSANVACPLRRALLKGPPGWLVERVRWRQRMPNAVILSWSAPPIREDPLAGAPLFKDEWREVIALSASGWTHAEIAARYGVSREHVRAGIRSRTAVRERRPALRRYTPSHIVEEAKRLRSEGHTIKEIARRQGVSMMTVRNRLRSPPRP